MPDTVQATHSYARMTGIRFYGYNLSLHQAPQELAASIREN